MDCPAFQYGSPGRAATIDGQGVLEPIPLSFAGVAKVGDQPQHISIPLKDEALVSRAKTAPPIRPKGGVNVAAKGAEANGRDVHAMFSQVFSIKW
jgi:hypothetical protein